LQTFHWRILGVNGTVGPQASRNTAVENFDIDPVADCKFFAWMNLIQKFKPNIVIWLKTAIQASLERRLKILLSNYTSVSYEMYQTKNGRKGKARHYSNFVITKNVASNWMD